MPNLGGGPQKRRGEIHKVEELENNSEEEMGGLTWKH